MLISVKMKRKIEDKLLQWKNSPKRMPLILNGARQVGKTYSSYIGTHKNRMRKCIYRV